MKLLHGSRLYVSHGTMSQFYLDQKAAKKAAEAGRRSRQITTTNLPSPSSTVTLWLAA